MLLKWALVILLGYFIYKKYIALPPGDDDGANQKLKNRNDANLKGGDDDYIDYEDVD